VAISDEDKERVRNATDLGALIAEVTSVKKSGRAMMAICPFHAEKTPSMSVDAARGLYHCFGCGRSGDLFTFVQETEGIGFTDAVELLARRADITLQRDPEAARRRGRRETLLKVMEAAVDFYNERLRSGGDAGSARRYLRGRGYDADVVAKYRLGFSPDDWSDLFDVLRSKGFGSRAIIAAGLAKRSSTGRTIDMFRGRVMFPVYDIRGDAVGFGARLLDGDGPKYINSPDGMLYHKGQLLYGLNWAKSDVVRLGEAIVVEGYTDVIAVQTAGAGGAVATCGTALGADHLDLLRRFTNRVVLAFDADAAGAGASLRGADLDTELDLRVAALPAGADPADMVQAGEVERLRKTFTASLPLLEFTLEEALRRFPLDEVEGRVRAVRAGAELVARHPDPLIRKEYAAWLARRTGQDNATVTRLVGDVGAGRRAASRRPDQRQPNREPAPTGRLAAEREVLRLLAANDTVARTWEVDESWFSDPAHAAVFTVLLPILDSTSPGEDVNVGAVVAAGGDGAVLLAALTADPRPVGDPDEVRRTLQVHLLNDRIEEVKRKLDSLSPQAEDYSRLLRDLIELERRRVDPGGRD